MNETGSPGGVRTFLPGLRALLGYDRKNLRHDFQAGVVVALVTIPASIAYAGLAHCPPITGLISAVGALAAFAVFTSSRHVITGPDAAVSLLIGSTIGALAQGDPGRAIALSAWMALFTGLILLSAAWLRFGATADLLSTPVMQGFLNGAAAVIVISQLDRLCGLHLQRENSLGQLVEWASRLGEIQPLPLIVGLGCVAALGMIRRLLPKAPAVVMLFVAALAAGALFDLPAKGLTVLGPLDTWLPPLPLTLTGGELTRLFTASIGLAVLIFPESIVLGRAVAEHQGYEVDPDRELFALGAANVTAGLLRGFAVGASQTRTLLNEASGGRTQAVSVIAAGCILAFLFFLSPLLAALPTIVLSAILLHTGLTLMDLRVYRRLWTLDRFSASVSALTTVGVIAVGVLPGILLGVGASLLRVLSQIARPQDALLGRIKGSATLHDVGDDDAAETIPGLVAYRFYGPLVFANVRFFIERIEHFLAQEKTPVRQLIVDARAIPEIDLTAAEQIKAFFSRLRERGIEVVIAKAHLPLRQAASLLGLGETFAQTRHFAELADAVADYERRHLGKDLSPVSGGSRNEER